jgi:PKD repeat protein
MEGGKTMRKIFSIIIILLSFSHQINAQIAGNWTCKGPIAFPTNVSGQIHGIGRCTQIKFHPVDSSVMYTTTASGGLYKSNNNGTSWTAMGTDILPNAQCASVCIDYTNDSVIYLGTGDPNYYGTSYGIYKTVNAGGTWTLMNSSIGNRMAIELLMDPNDHHILIAATNSGIWKTNDGGQTWVCKRIGGQFTDMVWKANAGTNTLYAATFDAVFRSDDRGDTWFQITNGLTPPGSNGGQGIRLGVSPADSNIVYVAMNCDEGTIFKSTDGGNSFTTVYHNPSQSLTGYDANGGGQGNYNFTCGVDPDDPNTVYIASHVVWKSTDGGITWTQLTQWWANLHTDMHHILVNPYNHSQLWEANDGGVWLSTNGGSFWTPKSDGIISTEIYHAGQSKTREDLISIGTQDNGELFHSLTTWKCNRGGDWGARCDFDYTHNNYVYYLSENQRRRLVPNGGSVSINLPVKCDGNTRISFCPSDTNVAYAGRDTLCVSTNIYNGSITWSIVSALGHTIRGIKANPLNANVVYVVTDNARVYRIEDAKSGNPQISIFTLPYATNVAASIEVVKSDTNIIYVTCNSRIYRSADRGQTWTNYTSNYPGLNLINVYYSSNEAIYIANAAGVYYRDSSMSNWLNYSGGLPTIAQIKDLLIYNDGTGLSKLRVAYYGKGVWEAPLNKNDMPVADFTSDKKSICENNQIQFTNLSTGALSVQWYFQGGTPSSSTAQNPNVTYSQPGDYLVSLLVNGSSGSNTIVRQGYIHVSAAHALSLNEGFENNFTYDWSLTDDGEDGIKWNLSSNAGAYGQSLNSVYFDNYSYDVNGRRDELITPRFITAGIADALLKFDVAYARYSPDYYDTLAVMVSTDCGTSFTQVYARGYTDLATSGDTTGFYVPGSNQWRMDSVSLTPFLNQNEIIIAFQNRGHYGNCVYLDNIRVDAVSIASPVANGTAFNKQVCSGESVTFVDQSSGSPSSRQWYFAGGTPLTSNLQNPVVVYNSPGVYPVALVVSNSNGTDSIYYNSFVEVLSPANSFNISIYVDSLVAPQVGLGYQWYYNNALIPGANSMVLKNFQPGLYAVAITDSNGCVNYSATVAVTVGLQEQVSESFKMEVYPNPAKDQMTIKLNSSLAGNANVIITDLNGKSVFEKVVNLQKGIQEFTIDCNQFNSGIYLVALQNQEMISSKKLMIIR